MTLVDESAYGSWRDYLVTMTVTGVLVELCAERERIIGKPVVEGMIQPDRTMSIMFIGERLFGRREKRREKERREGGMGVGGGGRIVWDGMSLHLSLDKQRERMDEFVAIGAVVPQESVPSIALRDATYAIGQVCHGKGMIGVFSISYCVFVDEWESLRMCAVDLSVGPLAASSAFRWMSYLLQGGIEIASGNSLLPRRGSTAALHPRQVACAQRVSPQAACGSASASARACACLSPAATRSFVIVQPFYQPELSRVPHGQFFSNCQEHNITFDFEGKCGVLFQLELHLIAGVVGFVACERSVELAARTAARALETVAVQMLHCAFVSALSWEEKKRMEKLVNVENWAAARWTELGRLAGLGSGLVKIAREKGDMAKAGLKN
ncbi:uncharacterized protein MONOS_13729 [Monocercomonoides exilis]|uniref:uncharacterized protein n=1 Tax=Monocercomonoides exilis TaxID=2049356 RepID=UPI00355AA16E|nr:hypothetical protein MONOS_13729 [Monocercomonoides exilis]|eukprot:MONOS_13729.1-p1 / transcript=MONOS_13729.1 / gene=MONOS_13729 / organism=Monocercomonoides_exilis_PA203 / gene_product=unspecified product / transcript_product=unspecified product / location=Mono_scaffold00872:12067-13296(+) / protein_length=382 / sequence_SO=supercontig / SO=protein_coding / is_pseudo=false